MDKQFKQLKEEYLAIPIPDELDTIVNNALKFKPKKAFSYKKWTAAIAAAAVILFAASVNISPAFAEKLADIPIIGKIVEVITFTEIKKETENNSSLDIQTPAIEGLENEELANSLNAKYEEESKQLYAEYEAYLASLKEGENANTAIISGYEVLTDNDIILSIRRFTEIIQASGAIKNQYDTIDKQLEVLITLKSLFKDDTYIEVISEEIKRQMLQQIQQDTNNMYWVNDEDPEKFTRISSDQSFYINQDGKLVITFNEYEVAPGYMGAVEFVIPTKVIKEILVGERYIN
ncbi:DUF3298 domain-containing protein [Bacillus sp. AGMB 02131]|uniref:DUF3298 domain-containing protein n=1 Tax=Peribacillus faecalis TaxID=2772559 RepID=A0A927CYD5_9BACI|nr:DUF3298 and DUF4163 domain-containing protein [Peribacillus faecalis]MBD3109921.1 DUF3298 domain-containing protein [Peribacillus faecalis]